MNAKSPALTSSGNCFRRGKTSSWGLKSFNHKKTYEISSLTKKPLFPHLHGTCFTFISNDGSIWPSWKAQKTTTIGGFQGLPACPKPLTACVPFPAVWRIMTHNSLYRQGGQLSRKDWERQLDPWWMTTSGPTDQWKFLDVHHQGALFKVQKVSSCCYCFLAGTWRCLVWWDVGNVTGYTCFSKQFCTMFLRQPNTIPTNPKS